MMAAAVEAVAFVQEAGIAHRSLGPSSFRVNTLDERAPELLKVRLTDFAFASALGSPDEDTIRRAAKAIGSVSRHPPSPVFVSSLLIKEDLQCLGYTFLELLITSLEVTKPEPKATSNSSSGSASNADTAAAAARAAAVARAQGSLAASTTSSSSSSSSGNNVDSSRDLTPPELRPSDQQSLRRLIQDIYSLDVKGRFREYALAEDSWSAAVSFLDENNGAGWE
eukprot:9109-Heterococcus_DN1.PRE.1